jgi:hypothetical protein
VAVGLGSGVGLGAGVGVAVGDAVGLGVGVGESLSSGVALGVAALDWKTVRGRRLDRTQRHICQPAAAQATNIGTMPRLL